MVFDITLFINGKEEGSYERRWLEIRLDELAAEFPDADLSQPIECGTMSLEIEGYWEAEEKGK